MVSSLDERCTGHRRAGPRNHPGRPTPDGPGLRIRGWPEYRPGHSRRRTPSGRAGSRAGLHVRKGPRASGRYCRRARPRRSRAHPLGVPDLDLLQEQLAVRRTEMALVRPGTATRPSVLERVQGLAPKPLRVVGRAQAVGPVLPVATVEGADPALPHDRDRGQGLAPVPLEVVSPAHVQPTVTPSVAAGEGAGVHVSRSHS
jgi:hypothetical protein